MPGEPDTNAGGNIVHLARKVLGHQYHKIYFDSFYTSVPVMSYQYGEGILALWSVGCKRVPDCKLPSESYMKKNPHDTSYECIAELVNGTE